MNHRIVLGHSADVAETAALTIADERADRRIVEELDAEADEMGRQQAIDAALGRLGKSDRDFVRAVLKRKSWREMGISKQLFSWRLKKLENFFSRINKG